MGFLNLFFYACLKLGFRDVETNPGPRRPVSAVCRILCSNVQVLAWNPTDLTVASFWNDIRLSSETGLGDVLRVGVAGSQFWSPCLVVLHCAGCPEPKGWRKICTRWKPKFDCRCYEILVFRVCGVT